LVVTGILVVLTTVVLANNNRFGGAIILRNLAYDMALSVREAQTYGISVRKFGASDFAVGYGVHIRLANPTSYVMFADTNENGFYTGEEELVRAMTISRGYRIADVCVTPATSATETCGIQKIDILFLRPEPDARIRINDTATLYQNARVILESPRGDRTSVIVEATGQIAVQ
jgi:hypothetical protein